MEKRFDNCEEGNLALGQKYVKDIKKIVNELVASCQDDRITAHIDEPLIPDVQLIIRVTNQIIDLLYPGYFGEQELSFDTLEYHIGSEVNEIYS